MNEAPVRGVDPVLHEESGRARHSRRNPSSARHRVGGLPGTGPMVLAALTVALVAIAATATVALVTRSRTSGNSAQPPGSSTSLSGHESSAGRSAEPLVAWLRTALPRTANLAAAAPDLGSAMRAAGYAAVADLATVVGQTQRSHWLVSRAEGDGALPVNLVNESVEIARIGTGPNAVVVGYLPPNPTPERRQSIIRDDHTKRVIVGASLAENAGLKTTPKVKAELQRGDIDPRAATLLALVTASRPTSLLAMRTFQAERTAGRPARTIDLADDPGIATVVSEAIVALPQSSRPARDVTRGNRITLTWYVAFDPMPTLS